MAPHYASPNVSQPEPPARKSMTARPQRPDPAAEALDLPDVNDLLAQATQDAPTARIEDQPADVRASVSFQTSTRGVWTFSVNVEAQHPQRAFDLAQQLAGQADAHCENKNQGLEV